MSTMTREEMLAKVRERLAQKRPHAHADEQIWSEVHHLPTDDVAQELPLISTQREYNTDEIVHDERAMARIKDVREIGYFGSTDTRMRCHLYVSPDDEDRGGFILRLQQNTSSNFQPFAINELDGLAIHVAGDGEARAAAELMIATLQEYLDTYRYKSGND